ncbi:MAG TPA: c-type cytochrome [Bryobacteraceae bacterium]|nr:c-type cytochrome [Bryobacteraceae bacterium]
MGHSKMLAIRALLLVGTAALVMAQETPRVRNRGERTREFLGLGPAPDPAAAARGEKLYAASCSFCHGDKATGGEGPDLVRSALVLHDEKGETIGPVILKGRPDKGMPSFPTFTQAQISDIAAFLHMRVELAVNRGLYQVLNVVTGDARAGEKYFNGAGHCNSCHSPTGDLAHIASKYSPADLQAQFLYPGASARYVPGGPKPPVATKVTVTLPSGQTISGVLKRLDDFNVSMYDSSGDYHSWPRDQVKIKVEDPLAAHRELLGKYSDADMHNLLAYLVTLK